MPYACSILYFRNKSFEHTLHNDGFKALVLVPTIDLKLQWMKELEEEPSLVENVRVVTYSGAYQFYKFEPVNAYAYILVDEAHHSLAPTLRKVIRHYAPSFLLGLTATDKRLDQSQLEKVFGEYEVNLDLKEAIQKGLLCQIRAFRLMTNVDLSQVRFNGKDYFASDLEKSISVPSRNEVIADTVVEYFHKEVLNKSGIVFCINVAHAKVMAKLLNERGITAASVDGKDKDRLQKIEAYMNQEIQFLCKCSLLTEGWDAPLTSVIVMARPTLSRVLYAQQLGRGTRNHLGKEALYVIDVVDNYGTFGMFSNSPWSVHASLQIPGYTPFSNMIYRENDLDNELTIIDSIVEIELKLAPIDVFTMQQLYEDYLSNEQLARELFVSTSTVNNWISKKRLEPDVLIPIGGKRLTLFKQERVDTIREKMGLKPHTEETVVEDFWAFIEEGGYTFSYKMFFILALLGCVDSTGEAKVEDVLTDYQGYYLERFREGLVVDRNNSPYTIEENVRDCAGFY